MLWRGSWQREGRLTAVQSSCEMVRSTSTGKDVSSTLLGSAPLLGCASRLEHAGYLSGSPAHKGEREVQGKKHS